MALRGSPAPEIHLRVACIRFELQEAESRRNAPLVSVDNNLLALDADRCLDVGGAAKARFAV